MPGYFSVSTIFLSFAIASLAGFAAFQSIEHTRFSQRPALWTFISGLTLGLGIWSMHFVGMMAWVTPFPLYYTLGDTVLSVVAAVAASWLAMYVTVRHREGSSQRNLVLGAFAVGSGICGMHYLGMAAMRFSPPATWSVPGVLLSYVIAVLASLGAMAMLQRSAANSFPLLQQIGASLVIGVAICGMHFTGMMAMMLPSDSICARQPGAVTDYMLARIGAGNALLFIVFLVVIVLLERRRREHTPDVTQQREGPAAAPARQV